MKNKILSTSLIVAIALGLSGCATTGTTGINTSTGEGEARAAGYFPATRPATGHKIFIFSPQAHAYAAYDANGNRVRTGKASGGQDFCPDIGQPCRTATGTYRVNAKGDADCISHIFPIETGGGAPMPYCMKFGGQGFAIHGSYDVPEDSNASHGCIRVTPESARWLSQNFVDIGTTVYVMPY